MMTMRYSVCKLVLFAALSISISESISSEHSQRGTGGGSQKRECDNDGRKRDGHSTAHSGCCLHSDCLHCYDHKRPFCSQGQCHCIDSECLHIDCSHHCNASQTFFCSLGFCHCGDIDCQHNLECSYHCRASEKSMCLHGRCSCIEPTTTTPLSSTTCLYHSDCNGHVCQAGHHPYCKFGQHSSECQCTVCTDDSHCSCPVGQIGKCHFDLFLLKYSCTCEHPAESTVTTQPLTTTHTTTTTITVRPSSQHQPIVSSTTDLPSTFDPTSLVQSSAAQLETNTTRQTTLASTMMRCHVCGDNINGISCDLRSIYTGNLQQCGPGEDFCMTDLIHDGQAYPKIYKRCVTEEECRNKWLHQTSHLEHCTNYGNVLVEGHYSCHFCCTSDGCNSNQIPNKSTQYIKV